MEFDKIISRRDESGVERVSILDGDGNKVAHRETKEGTGLFGYETSEGYTATDVERVLSRYDSIHTNDTLLDESTQNHGTYSGLND